MFYSTLVAKDRWLPGVPCIFLYVGHVFFIHMVMAAHGKWEYLTDTFTCGIPVLTEKITGIILQNLLMIIFLNNRYNFYDCQKLREGLGTPICHRWFFVEQQRIAMRENGIVSRFTVKARRRSNVRTSTVLPEGVRRLQHWWKYLQALNWGGRSNGEYRFNKATD